MNVQNNLTIAVMAARTPMALLNALVTKATCSMMMVAHANVEEGSLDPVANSPPPVGPLLTPKKTWSANGL